MGSSCSVLAFRSPSSTPLKPLWRLVTCIPLPTPSLTPRRDYQPHNGGGTGSYEDGTADPLATPVYEALHSGCPVVEGEKFVMTRWIRGARFY